jgi:hypothetical protein
MGLGLCHTRFVSDLDEMYISVTFINLSTDPDFSWSPRLIGDNTSLILLAHSDSGDRQLLCPRAGCSSLRGDL